MDAEAAAMRNMRETVYLPDTPQEKVQVHPQKESYSVLIT
jgi:hypothetical protein